MTLGGFQSRSKGFWRAKGPLFVSAFGRRCLGYPACSFLRMDVIYCLIKSVCVRAVRCNVMLADWLQWKDSTPHCYCYGEMRGTRQNTCRLTLVVTGCPCRAVGRWSQTDCTLPVAVLHRQLLRQSCAAGWQTADGRRYWHSQQSWRNVRCSQHYSGTVLASVVVSDVQNESSAVEMYQAVRCHIPEDLSVRVSEFLLQPIDFGMGTCWKDMKLCRLVMGSDQICCCSVVLLLYCLTVVVLLYCCSVLQLLYYCAVLL